MYLGTIIVPTSYIGMYSYLQTYKHEIIRQFYDRRVSFSCYAMFSTERMYFVVDVPLYPFLQSLHFYLILS